MPVFTNIKNVVRNYLKTAISIFIFIVLIMFCNDNGKFVTTGNQQIGYSSLTKNTDTITRSKIDLIYETENIKLYCYTTIDLKKDTIRINDQNFIQILKDGKFNCLLSIQGDTIVKSKDYYLETKFIDIDEDGYKDVRIFVFSNTPNQCDTYLFDQELKTFKLIENCDLDIQIVKGTKFFYSYNRAGCADMNWESHLSKIEKYKLVDYGYIHGQGCDFEIEKNPQVIEIYKVTNSGTDDKKLIKKLSYQKHIKKIDDKWNFIEKYWTQNYKTFE